MSKSDLLSKLFELQEQSEERFDITCEWKGNKIVIEYK